MKKTLGDLDSCISNHIFWEIKEPLIMLECAFVMEKKGYRFWFSSLGAMFLLFLF